MRPLLVTSFGAAFAVAAVWSVAGTVALGSSVVSGPASFLPKPRFQTAERIEPRLPERHAEPGKASRLRATAAQALVTASVTAGGRPFMTASLTGDAPSMAASLDASAPKSARLPDASEGTGASGAARFDAVVKKAALTSEKLAALFDRSASAKAQRAAAKAGAPAEERFASPPKTALPMLAYVDPSPNAAGAALSALLADPSEEDLAASQDPDMDDAAAALPDAEDLLSHPVPQPRPRVERAGKPDAETEKPQIRRAEEPAAPKAEERQKPKPQKLAYARPNDPTEEKSRGGFGKTLRNLFGGGTRAGNGVAVYDISAAKVYMPDGSVLEAHSGIGNMADDPRYAHVKMKGPTPPHTYNLKMREKLFHGVEAIRMLPVDGKNKHGRDGFLTHSYLLRGGRAESHGCVAFKNYDRFLTTFKQGKIKQLVVVPSGGRATMLASNGNRI
ncbi:tlde1 domain-containing protein [Mesorhizobium sp. WSM2239]|uniref:Tlde1 domain-containing protein n=2 Tax=unclassified Mesorhizobium TaxID=325217 RepID=A0AAU8D6I5_9HYPH